MCGSEAGSARNDGHVPVLLDAAVSALLGSAASDARILIDGTFGRGGHARAVLDQLTEVDRLVVIDRDPEAIAEARRLAARDARVVVVEGAWDAALALLSEAGICRWHGVLLDLGVSSPQLDDPARGFSFRNEGPLDMRMNPNDGLSAAEWLNSADEREISKVLFELGEEPQARRIARSICARRPLKTTTDLVAAVREAAVHRSGYRHEATRTFQAVRIHVNDELGVLDRSLPMFFAGLVAGGRLVVISFHSLEDRIVKHRFRDLSSPPVLPRRLPVRAEAHRAAARLVGKPVAPSAAEAAANARARSARLRVLERLA